MPPRNHDTEDLSPFMPNKASPLGASPKRVPDGETMRPQRHVLRPADEYSEYEEINELRIPRTIWPEGFSLQWVTESVWGQPMPQNRARYERGGWVAVHQEDFENRYRGMFMPKNYEGEIRKDGLILMARSKAWTDRAQALDVMRARQRVQIKEQQLRSGDLTGVTLASDHPSAVRSNVIERSIDTIAVPLK